MDDGNTFGKKFRVTTYGESHGEAVGAIIEGCPIGTELDTEKIQLELDRRKPGIGAFASQRKEPDKLVTVSGIENGKVTGKKIQLEVKNLDARPKDYSEIIKKPRPGHADLSYFLKYGKITAGGGRASGRETIGRVLAGAIAKQLLERKGIEIRGKIIEIGGAKENFAEVMQKAKEENNSVGGIIEITATGVPAGLGEPVFDKLSADLAKGLMSIPSIKGIEIGAGFHAAKMRGSQDNDPITIEGGKIITKTNNAGGILGGISNGMPVVCRIAVKPASSIGIEQDTIDISTMKPTKLKVEGRHDSCICPRVVPVAEAMVALVIIDHLMRK